MYKWNIELECHIHLGLYQVKKNNSLVKIVFLITEKMLEYVKVVISKTA